MSYRERLNATLELLAKPRTAYELAKQLRISPQAVYARLHLLEELGEVSVGLTSTGRPGRPATTYCRRRDD